MSETLQPVHEDEIKAAQHPDRWSKDLIGQSSGAVGGFSLGVALYTSATFGELQVHDDQEAVFVVSGQGEMQIDGRLFAVRPGSAAYVPKGAAHAMRRTTEEPVKVVYSHGKL